MIKRIQTHKDKTKKDKRNQLILAGVLIVVMFGSVFGIVVNSFGGGVEGSTITYNGFIFLNENGFYSTQVGNYRYYFSNNPKDIGSLQSNVFLEKSLPDYFQESVYISSQDYNSFSEIEGNLYQYALKIEEACKEGDVCYNELLPKKTCLDNMIIIKVAEENRIYEESNCVYIEGKEKDLLKMTDKFLFNIIGIDK
ncbi:MAG: hypothetical protein NUV46_01090 [Nanoarchaeota archaeon]|nr:hypothetical protein [Nanoarchaeota archaeon]